MRRIRKRAKTTDIIIEHFENESDANESFMKEVGKHFNLDKAIKCVCVRCGGEGYAQDESLLDANGFLKGATCICGGAIRREW